MRNINKRLKQEGGADIVGEKLFSLYLAVKEVITYRSIGEAKYELFKCTMTKIAPFLSKPF